MEVMRRGLKGGGKEGGGVDDEVFSSVECFCMCNK